MPRNMFHMSKNPDLEKNQKILIVGYIYRGRRHGRRPLIKHAFLWKKLKYLCFGSYAISKEVFDKSVSRGKREQVPGLKQCLDSVTRDLHKGCTQGGKIGYIYIMHIYAYINIYTHIYTYILIYTGKQCQREILNK